MTQLKNSTQQKQAQISARTARAVEKLKRAVEKSASELREAADNVVRMPSVVHLERELKSVEAYIRDMSAAGGHLTYEEGRQLAEAKEFRRTTRQEIQEIIRPYQARADLFRNEAWKMDNALKKFQKARDEDRQLRALLNGFDEADFYTLALPGNRVAISEAVAVLRILDALEQQDANGHKAGVAEPTLQDAEESTNQAAALYLPPASDLEFFEGDVGIVERAAKGLFDSRVDYNLNRVAQELSLAGGFEVLLCPPLLRGVEPYPFQINTARQVLRTMRGRALLCDEVGLGKTVEAGFILKEYLVRALARKVLILVPPALVSQWREEMKSKFDIEFVTHEDSEFRAGGTDAWERFDRVIASLHTAKSSANAAVIQKIAYDIIIVDEAHHLKNRTTVNWQFVNGVKSKYLLLLTATPAQNNLDELFNLITLLSPGQLKTPAAFRKEFVASGDPRMPKNRTKLRELLQDVMVRNTRSQVSVVLPPRRAHTLRMPLSPTERALYDGISEFVRLNYRGRSSSRLIAQTLQAEAGSSMPSVLSTLDSLNRRDTELSKSIDTVRELALAVKSSSKADALLHLLRQRSEKTLIFTRYRETQKFLLAALEHAGIRTASFGGDMSAAEKDAQVAAFAGDRQVLVSTDVGSEGRNLQFCRTLVNYDLPWNPMQIEQRVGRVHRIGQTEPVHIFNLAAQDTLEDYILEVLDSKINMFELVVGEVGEILGNLSDDREFEEVVLDLWMGAESTEAAHKAFTELGDQMVEARQRYEQSKEYDEALFSTDFVAEEV